MIKVTKRYTIKFVKGGILQFADFSEDSDGILVNPRFFPQWTKSGEAPDVSNMKTIDEVLEAIKSFSYGNRAEIWLINGRPPSYENNNSAKDLIKTIISDYDNFIKAQLTLFFNKELMPLIKKNKWNIGKGNFYNTLIEKDENGEWDNVKNSKELFEFEYLCAKCMKTLNLIEKINLTSEQHIQIYESHKLFNFLDNLEDNEFYVAL